MYAHIWPEPFHLDISTRCISQTQYIKSSYLNVSSSHAKRDNMVVRIPFYSNKTLFYHRPYLGSILKWYHKIIYSLVGQ